jgi:hypothetical protein
MSQTEAVHSNRSAGQGQQAPRIVFKLLNPVMKLILNSPFHRLMSSRVMVISFTGRKSGKRFATPVAYTWEGNRVIVVTYSAWRNNFKEPAPVQLRIQGKDVRGMAQWVRDPLRIKPLVQTLMVTGSQAMLERMGLWIGNLDSATPEEILQATQGSYFIDVDVEH